MFSFICVWINDWVNNREAGDLRPYSGHYDVIVMLWDLTTRRLILCWINPCHLQADEGLCYPIAFRPCFDMIIYCGIFSRKLYDFNPLCAELVHLLKHWIFCFKMFFHLRTVFPMTVIFLYETSLIQRIFSQLCGYWRIGSLTHWGRDKMDAISQTTFSSAFSWMKMFEFQLEFHWSLFLRV